MFTSLGLVEQEIRHKLPWLIVWEVDEVGGGGGGGYVNSQERYIEAC